MFKLSIYEKVENKREKAPMLHAPGLICIPFYLFEIPVPIPYRTDPIGNGWSELLTHACETF